MSRTTIEIPMKTNDVEGVLGVISGALSKLEMKEKVIDGETAWAKGDGVFTIMMCVSATFTSDGVILQGWARDVLFGESALDNGFLGGLPKKQLKKHIEAIRDTIIVKGL